MYGEYLGAVIIVTVLMHIIDDFVLQPVCLSKLKQASTWNGAPAKYRNDYKAALIIHGFSWSSLVMLPALVLMQFQVGFAFIGVWIIMGSLHAVIDDLKANIRMISLLTDQTLHTVQIAVIILMLWAGWLA